MRSSLGQIFFSLIVVMCLTATAFGQARNQGTVQQADYWQPSGTQQRSVYQTVGYNHTHGADCGCATQQSAPTPTTSMISLASGTTGSCETCGPSEVFNDCSTGGCSTGTCGVEMNACDPCGTYDMGCTSFMNPCQPNQWFLTGWIQQGVTINPFWPDNRFNGTLRYNDRANDYQMNQLYLTMGRSVNSEACNWDIGGRVDVLYGTDYFFTSALGWETETTGIYGGDVLDPTGAKSKWNKNDGPRRDGTAAMYGLSIPQLYGEVQAPMGTNVKLGHFYSPMGHESVMATQNFFYSHSYSMMYGEPTTITGMLLSQRLTQNWTGYFGLHQGWDKWESPISEMSYMAGIKWENYFRTTSVGFLINTGKDAYDNTGIPRQTANRTNYSLIFSHQLSPNLHYVLQHDLGIDENAGYNMNAQGMITPVDGKWYSISQYIYAQMTDTLAFGCRAEWFKDENHSRILKGFGPTSYVKGDEYVELTLGFNWKPTPFIMLRPEVRWDWIPGREQYNPLTDQYVSSGPFNDGTKNRQFTIGTDLVITF